MTQAEEVQRIARDISIWQVYEPTVKAELFSTSLATDLGDYLVDPVPLAPDPLTELRATGNAIGIFITNANHARASAAFARAFAIPTYVHQALAETSEFSQANGVQDGQTLAGGLTAIAIDGGAEGEMALHSFRRGGCLVMGDALINFEPHGFGLLPSKYCLDSRLMRRSLSKLLDYAFERIFFAHGTPILSGARAKVEQLLAGNR
jgi:hypothetical protein